MSDAPPCRQRRQILIAMSIAAGSNRDSACRLGAALPRWIELPPGPHPAAAAELRVSSARLEEALRLVPRAAQIAAAEEAACRRLGVTILTRLDPDYPPALLDLSLPPPLLYRLGHLHPAPAIAVVGSRRSDPYGLEVSEMFANELAAAGVTIVSGLAIGIDAAAHRGALEATGRTVAVLGCGLDVTYPYRNRSLADEIPNAGAILSEFPLGTPPKAAHFPVRNRIIAALASGTLVVRGTPHSGSLITARHALDLGREVFAVPGNIFDTRSLGPNSLIRDGALPVQHPREILEALPTREQARLEPRRAAARRIQLEGRLAETLELFQPGETIAQEDVLERSALATADTLSALVELELTGHLRRHAGSTFTRRVAVQNTEPTRAALRQIRRQW